MRKLLVLGAAGFSGRSFLATAISRWGKEIEILAADLMPIPCKAGIRAIILDAIDATAVNNLMEKEKPDVIVNLTGSFSASNYQDLVRFNTEPTRLILEAAISNGIKLEKVLVVGSAAEYGAVLKNPVSETAENKPVNYYGLSKVFQTQLSLYYARMRSLPVIIARPFNILGQGQSPALAAGNWELQIAKARNGDSINVGNIHSKRDFLHIDEVSNKYCNLIDYGYPGEIYNICSGNPIPMEDILWNMIAKSGKKLTINIDPNLFKENEIPEIYGDNTKYESIIK
jgi:GDP-4-dehydro-6-deoxy-D-mannose reductase